MKDTELYAQMLGLKAPWGVSQVALNPLQRSVHVSVVFDADAQWCCPKCGKPAPRYDKRVKQWRHLDTMQFKTILEAEVPRVECPEDGISQVRVPWAEPGSGFTALFEALVIFWLKHTTTKAVADALDLSWNAVDGIAQRAVQRGLARREARTPAKLSVDETSFQKRHEYVTLVTDQATGHVLYVADDRKTESLSRFYEGLNADQIEAIEAVAMDMWPAYIKATRLGVPDADAKIAFDKFHVAKALGDGVDKVRKTESLSRFYEGLNADQIAAIEAVAMDMWPAYIKATRLGVPHADTKIAFDKFHVAKALGDGVDRVRKEEHRALLAMGDSSLKGTKYQWLYNPSNMTRQQRAAFSLLRDSHLRTARAWAMKEQAMDIWRYKSGYWATKAWDYWFSWAQRCRLGPMKKVAAMLKEHLWGIMNAIVLNVNNGHAESANARIQRIKARACGFRNRERFKAAIYFHCGGLDLMPDGVNQDLLPT